jgi:hypothetical protein
MALERDQVDRCGDDAGVGQDDDMEGSHPIVALSRKVYHKGVTLSKRAMRVVENRLTRHPELPNWDILIQPVSTS